MSKKKALLLVNPRSGKIVQKQLSFSFGTDFLDTDYEPFIRLTTGPKDATDVAARLSKDYDLLICRGGDGTLNETINGLMQSGVQIPIGYIPGGTTNDFAKSNGIPCDASEAIRLILEGEPHPQDIGLFGENTYFSYTASFGLFTKASYATSQKIKNRYGYAAYLFGGAQELRHIDPIPLRVVADGVTYEGEYIFGSITNALSVGGGVLKFSKDNMKFDDGLFEMVLVKKPRNMPDLLRVFSELQKGIYDEEYITVVQGKVFLFDFLGRQIPWSVDGEFGGETGEVAIQCIHHGIQIYKPSEDET